MERCAKAATAREEERRARVELELGLVGEDGEEGNRNHEDKEEEKDEGEDGLTDT